MGSNLLQSFTIAVAAVIAFAFAFSGLSAQQIAPLQLPPNVVLEVPPPPAPKPVIESPHITNWGTWGQPQSCGFGTFATGYTIKMDQYSATRLDNTALDGIQFICAPPGEKEPFLSQITSSVGEHGDWGRSMYTCPQSDPIAGKDKARKELYANVMCVFCPICPQIFKEYYFLHQFILFVHTGFQIAVVPFKGTKLRIWKDSDDVATVGIRFFSVGKQECNISVGVGGAAGGAPLPEYLGDKDLVQWTTPVYCPEEYAVCGLQTQLDEGRML